ncbi:hypothetical protein [Mesorhizobium sp. B2-3-10]|uniref:hypothetical protein n=1 Tax=Mesorhizobium sp. B2-3-10 TaxID=2589954 RepID=UPI001128D188|nr:hypothetical protein [Mesorhizobium sp. B2-3-10]TPL94759.1 hypothetical protein FJ943_25070 [Mesorhizobium sp. B2-3-10]
MAKLPDLSSLSLDELNALIAEATKLRDEKVQVRRAELLKELEALGGLPSGGKSKPSAEGRTRSSPRVQFRGPNGEEYTNRGPLPKWARDLGIKDKAGLEKYRVAE